MQIGVHAIEVQLMDSALDVETIYHETADFTWRTLQRLGIRGADLEDVMQEVYVVVHRRLGSYDQECRITTWIFGICLKVASRHRRRAWFRRERHTAELPQQVDDRTPEDEATRLEAQRRLGALLGELGLEQRVVFVMFEIEGRSCAQIAGELGIPVGTVYSRLHTARAKLQHAATRLHDRPQTGVRS